MITTRQITIEELIAQSESHEAVLEILKTEALEGALLPPEFIQGYIENAKTRPKWLGVWAFYDGILVGSGGYRSAPMLGITEIGYGVAPEIEGKGVGTAIAAALIELAFAQGATTVMAHTLPISPASQKILTKNGFKFITQEQDPEDGLVNRYELTRLQ